MEFILNWLDEIQQTYGVNPYIFGAIYVGAIPVFWYFTILLVRNLRNNKSISVPVLGMAGSGVSSYIYLLIAGNNIPVWVYGVVIFMIFYSLYSVRKQARKSKAKVTNEL
jgi:hypothetical protein